MLSLINLNAISPLIPTTTNSSLKVPHSVNLSKAQNLPFSALGFNSIPTPLFNSATAKHSFGDANMMKMPIAAFLALIVVPTSLNALNASHALSKTTFNLPIDSKAMEILNNAPKIITTIAPIINAPMTTIRTAISNHSIHKTTNPATTITAIMETNKTITVMTKTVIITKTTTPIANHTNNNNNTQINNHANNTITAKITILTNNPSVPTINKMHHKTNSKIVHNNNRTNAPTTMIIATILRAILIHASKTLIAVTTNINTTT